MIEHRILYSSLLLTQMGGGAIPSRTGGAQFCTSRSRTLLTLFNESFPIDLNKYVSRYDSHIVKYLRQPTFGRIFATLFLVEIFNFIRYAVNHRIVSKLKGHSSRNL